MTREPIRKKKNDIEMLPNGVLKAFIELNAHMFNWRGVFESIDQPELRSARARFGCVIFR